MSDISAPDDERAHQFWTEQLAGDIPVLELAFDRRRTAQASFTAGWVHCELAPGAGAVVAELAARSGATIEAVVLAAFATVLQRYASQDEIVVGIELAPGGERLPIRVDFGAGADRPAFRAVLDGVHRRVDDARRYAAYPVRGLIDQAHGAREVGRPPLMQAVFAAHGDDAASGAPFDLSLRATPAPGGDPGLGLGLRLGLGYDAALFDRATAERMLAALEVLLASAAADPGAPATQLPMLATAERDRVVAGFNTTARARDGASRIHDRVAAHAAHQPDAVAIAFEGRELTYRELDHKANALAAHLQSLGAAPDAPIGLYLERSPELLVGMIGVLKSGAAYLPLDPTYPSDRLAYMLEDAQVGIVISRPELFGFLRDKYPAATLVDAEAFTAAAGSPVQPPCQAGPENLIYIIYTSGSTGKPKGVMLPHAAVDNFAAWQIRTYGLGPGDRCLAFISPSFDVSGWEVFAALCSGATLVISRRQDPPSLARLIHDERITFAVTMPSILESLMTEDAFRAADSLRALTSGAEALSVALHDAYLALGRGELHNAGGPTETAIASVHWKCAPGPHRSVPYGRPIDNTQVYLLDDDLEPVPIGVRGEMYIAGAGLARGFVNRPDLTADRFLPDPFSAAPGGRMYKTGDHARWLPDGSVELLGRIDEQIKIRGFRIELGEVGGVLAQHPEIRESVVVARGDTARDRRLIGYVVGHRGRPDPRALTAWLRGRLPEYMVPSVIVVLDDMPHLPNGKLDRSALPAPTSSAEYVAPRTTDERALAEVWSELLGVERVGAGDHFFELGGHSLMATQLLSRVRDAFGVELPLRAVFDHPTLDQLAAAVAGAMIAGAGGAASAASVAAPRIAPIDRTGGAPLALSFAQQRLWFLDQLEPGSPVYNEPVVIRLTGALDAAALERSVNAVVARHEALRTTFAAAGGEPYQVIHAWDPGRADLALAVPRIDLSQRADLVSSEAREAEARRLAVAEARRPFDLARGPLLRLAVFQLAAGDHALLLVMHHIVGDDWSLAVLWNEIAEAYRAISAGSAVELPPLAVQYADFAAWQRDWLAGGELARQLDYWKARLAGAPGLIELPTDRPRPAVASHAGASLGFELGAPLASRIAGVSRALSATPFMVLLAAFQALLQRYTRQDDVVTGTVIANRNRAETEGLIGFFVNTLVCRTDLSGAPTFRELVGRVREVALGAYDHQDVPFERIVEELHPQRSLAHAPLFQVLFVLQNAPPVRALPGIAQRIDDLDIGIAKFDLTLYLEDRSDRAGGLRGRLEYRSDLFDASTIARMVGHFECLLDGIAADPDRAVGAIPLVTSAERHQLVTAWNATELAFPRDQRVHDLLAAQVARTPDAIAIECAGHRLTYRELDRRATQLAHHLRAHGIAADVLVAIFAERSLEMAIAMIAVHKAGGAYVPLDPSYPEDRIAFIQDDTRSPVILTQDRLVPRLPAGPAKVIRLDADWPEIERAVAPPPPPRATTARDLSHIIYTSGSTGRPKGVAIEHHSVVSFCCWARDAFTPAERAGVLFSTSICFDLSVYELFATLAWGGRVILVDNVLGLAQLPADAGVTLVNTVPSALAALLKTTGIPASVTTVNLAGEPLKNPLVTQIYATGTVERVYDLYGPSETTTYSTYTLRRDGAPPSIGRPLANTSVYVLDPAGGLVPRGVVGELWIGGEGVARGYLGRPELTDERFVRDPYARGGRDGDRMYKTGDLARWLPDGTLEYRGRIDHQVKIRGFRIELGEIEAALVRLPGVRESVAIVRDDLADDPRIVAYLAGPSVPAQAELVAALAATLPAHMVPSAFVALDALPLTPNGKLDRKALLAIVPTHQRTDDRALPTTATEREVARLFEQLLRVPDIGARDGFFALGGHSLLATQIVSRVRDAFGVELPLKTLFEAPTVESFAAVIDAAAARDAGAARSAAAPAIARIDRGAGRGAGLGPSFALSFAQQRMWFLDQLEPGSPFYNVAMPLGLRGPLDAARLARSLQQLVARHEALRTSFTVRDGQVFQVIAPALELALPIVDLSGLPAAERDAAARRRAIEDARRPFDLVRGPLVRASLLRLADDDHWLLPEFHHIVSDGWSIEILWRELAAIYAADAAGRAADLPPLAVQYVDFAAWQRAWLTGAALDEQLAYWRDQLRGAPSLLELPTDRPRPPVTTYRGALYDFDVPAEVAAPLAQLARAESATLFMTLLAAFHALLHRHSGQDDILVGTPVANRNRAELEGVFGLFVNTLVIRGDASGDPSFRALLARVRAAALGAYGHQDVPFERLVEELRPERSLSYSPVFQVMFDLITMSDPAGFPGLAARRIDIDGGVAKFDLSLTMEDRGAGGLRGSFEYNTDLFDEPTIARIAGHFARLLAQVAADPARPLSQLALADAAERRRAVIELNATARDYPTGERVFESFERWADAAPDRIAVVCEGQGDPVTIAYGALDARANQLAHHLRELGVGREVLVGVALERSIELAVALLAIVKAGGAYVPLDPDYPPDRLAFMIADARPRVVLIQDRLRAQLPTGDAPVLAIDAAWPEIARRPTTRLATQVRRGDPIYAIYTSGSTGRPKGVVNLHAGAENHLGWLVEELGFGPDDRLLHKTQISFDASVWELFLPLATGARLVMARPGGHQDPQYLADAARREAITVMQFVPAMLGLVLEARGIDAATTVRHVIVGGEALPRSMVVRFRDRLPGAVLHNLYGQTEASDDTSHWACGADEPPVVPIGRPIGNVQVYVLDRHFEPAPIGVAGEICVGGAGLARGYLDRPALTAERFIPDPFGPPFGAAGGRLYRTGDRGRIRGDGVLEFLGRIDHQVKLRGFRIELGEIEAELALQPGVREAVAIVRDDPSVGRQLVGYVVGGPGAAELRAALRERLPDYMVPAAIVRLDELPVTPNGKLDRKALPAPAIDDAADADATAPRTHSELAVARVFGELLGRPQVGARADFFALGGHSLLAVQLFAQIEARLGVALPIATVFRAPTVEALAREVDDRAAAASSAPSAAPSPLVALRPGGARAPVICVHPIGGSVFCYQPLIARLAGDRPYFGLEARGLTDGAAPAESIAEMADAYARAVVAAHPDGPLHVVGWSFGGLVALELGQGLQRAGRDVASITLIDAFAPPPGGSPPLAPHAVLAVVAGELGLAITERELSGLDAGAALARVAELAHAAGVLPAHLGTAPLARRIAVIAAHLRAEDRCVPRPPSGSPAGRTVGRVTLVRARDASVAGGVDAAATWRPQLGELAVIDAPGDHFSMFRPPHVDELARVIDAILAATGA